ncbi:MAG: ClpXP protease specificity-enhancing factor SspB [Alphaproteobacteria bacterium]|nr:ClpXP protease specificity-enhancing factor SspB [Alphaproteobacteria bacterium]
MTPTEIRYDELVEGALKGVLKFVLTDVVENGLPGQHHFYITFRTQHPDVDISDTLRNRYPDEMTIVLQYQFWELTVDDRGFGVTLSFDDQPERLEVPFDAVTGFLDPSVKFGLQFRAIGMPDEEIEAEDDESGEAAPAQMLTGGTPDAETGKSASRKTGRPDKKADNKAAEKTDEDADDADSEGGGDNVVTLDAFRKK